MKPIYPRKKSSTLALWWYSPPKFGGHRQVLVVGGYPTKEQWRDKNRKVPAGKEITEQWYFDNLEELMRADRLEWEERTLDKDFEEQEALKEIKFFGGIAREKETKD